MGKRIGVISVCRCCLVPVPSSVAVLDHNVVVSIGRTALVDGYGPLQIKGGSCWAGLIGGVAREGKGGRYIAGIAGRTCKSAAFGRQGHREQK